MQWLLLGVVAIALLYMSNYYPRTALGILGALTLAAAVIVLGTREDALRARHKLPAEDIRIENPVITPAYGDSYQFNARLVNTNESILLKELVVSLTMLDCRGESEGDCAVIGQTDERINTRIPAGQARDISRNVFFSDAEPSGSVRWEYRVTETRN